MIGTGTSSQVGVLFVHAKSQLNMPWTEAKKTVDIPKMIEISWRSFQNDMCLLRVVSRQESYSACHRKV